MTTTTSEVLEEQRGAATCRRTLRIPAEAEWLDGHFPGFAVVPAVVQLLWVMDALRSLCGDRVSVRRLEALKFRGMIRPGDLIHLDLELRGPEGPVQFRLSDERAVYATGRCVVERYNGET